MSENTKETISLAIAISTALLMTNSSQAAPAIAPNTTPSFNNPLLLAYNNTNNADAFFQHYTYCDAKLLGAYWGKSTYDAKIRAGEKILRGGRWVVNHSLRQARNQSNVNCSYYEEGYSYDDAVLLAKYWGKNTPWDAKLKINNLLKQGYNSSIKTALKQAKENNVGNVEDQQFNAYANSIFGYYDAEILANYWGKSSPWEAKLKIGNLIMKRQNGQVKQALQAALR